jgi:hypothetical protein
MISVTPRWGGRAILTVSLATIVALGAALSSTPALAADTARAGLSARIVDRDTETRPESMTTLVTTVKPAHIMTTAANLAKNSGSPQRVPILAAAGVLAVLALLVAGVALWLSRRGTIRKTK